MTEAKSSHHTAPRYSWLSVARFCYDFHSWPGSLNCPIKAHESKFSHNKWPLVTKYLSSDESWHVEKTPHPTRVTPDDGATPPTLPASINITTRWELGLKQTAQSWGLCVTLRAPSRVMWLMVAFWWSLELNVGTPWTVCCRLQDIFIIEQTLQLHHFFSLHSLFSPTIYLSSMSNRCCKIGAWEDSGVVIKRGPVVQ